MYKKGIDTTTKQSAGDKLEKCTLLVRQAGRGFLAANDIPTTVLPLSHPGWSAASFNTPSISEDHYGQINLAYELASTSDYAPLFIPQPRSKGLFANTLAAADKGKRVGVPAWRWF